MGRQGLSDSLLSVFVRILKFHVTEKKQQIRERNLSPLQNWNGLVTNA